MGKGAEREGARTGRSEGDGLRRTGGRRVEGAGVEREKGKSRLSDYRSHVSEEAGRRTAVA